MNPQISIIVPFFNSERTLARAVGSVLSQSFGRLELILVNDGSKDTSAMIAGSFLPDLRVKLLSQHNKGVSAARNLGASEAISEWLIFLDSDDQLTEGFLQRVSEEIQPGNDFDYLVFGINRINGSISTIVVPLQGHYFSRLTGTFVIRRSKFNGLGGYDERLKFSENTELFHRLDLIHARSRCIPWVSLNYFESPTGGSKNLQNMIDSLGLILDKHSETLSLNVKHLYHQIIGVNHLRFRNYPLARKHLRQALFHKPLAPKTWVRLVISLLPSVSKKLYPREVKT